MTEDNVQQISPVKNKGHILILEDDIDVKQFVEAALLGNGYTVEYFSRAAKAIQDLQLKNDSQVYDLIISDIKIPEMDGFGFLDGIRKNGITTPVIMMTAHANFDNALQALRLGVVDFLRKPFTAHELLFAVERALSHYKLEIENQFLTNELNRKWKLDSIIGRSQKMQDVFGLVKRVATTSATVLITGESGTGKEMVARAIHENSPRANKPFVAINCAAIPEALLESEFFGHSKGSFTGAIQNRKGLFQEADGGTLFLDEIGDLSLALQAKLLRVLQDKKIKPVGDNSYKNVDVRILAATHRNLRNSMKKELFREDLFYRLNVIPIAIPSLRERQEDIMMLAQHFLLKFASLHGLTQKKLSKEAIAYLTSYKWPGNIRELENSIERALVVARDSEIQKQDLDVSSEEATEEFRKSPDSTYLSLGEMEMKYISFILGKTGGKKEMAARILKIDRTTLHRKVTDHGLQPAGPNDDCQFDNVSNCPAVSN